MMCLHDILMLSVSKVLSYSVYELPEKPSGHLIAEQFAGLHLKSLNCPFFFPLGGHSNLWPSANMQGVDGSSQHLRALSSPLDRLIITDCITHCHFPLFLSLPLPPSFPSLISSPLVSMTSWTYWSWNSMKVYGTCKCSKMLKIIHHGGTFHIQHYCEHNCGTSTPDLDGKNKDWCRIFLNLQSHGAPRSLRLHVEGSSDPLAL